MQRNILLAQTSHSHDHLVGDGFRLLHLYQSYPGAYASIDNVCQIMLLCKQHNQRLIVSRSQEPNLLWTHPDKVPRLFIFDVIAQACDRTCFPMQNVTIVSANILAEQCAQDWLAQSPYTTMFSVVSHNHWIKSVCTVYPKLDCYTALEHKQRTRYFSCFNGTFRYHKWEVAQLMFLKGHFTELADRSYQSFIFNEIKQGLPANITHTDLLSVLPRNLEHNLPIHPIEDDNVPHYISIKTPQYETAVTDSYFDVVVEFHTMEDLGEPLYSDVIAEHPWWRENIISEKVLKNFLCKRPFILIAEPGTLAYMRDELGFQTYDMIFDESYDQIQDRHTRIATVVQQVTDIVNTYSLSQFHEIIYSDRVQQVIEHNHRRLYEINSQTKSPYQ
jgi:hypothetical protein